MKARGTMTRQAAEQIAIQALSFIASDGERLGRFLSATGIGPTEIRAVSHQPGFLAGVLQYLASEEPLAASFVAELRCRPDDIAHAYVALGGEAWEREIP